MGWIRWCSTRWRLGVYHGARRGEVAGAVHIDSRDEGRVEDRNDFGVISSTAEPVFEACLCWELKACVDVQAERALREKRRFCQFATFASLV